MQTGQHAPKVNTQEVIHIINKKIDLCNSIIFATTDLQDMIKWKGRTR